MTVATSSLLLYLSPSHLSPHIPLMGNWELISPHPSLLSLQGWENLLQEESPQPALATCHFLLPTHPSPHALVRWLLPFL